VHEIQFIPRRPCRLESRESILFDLSKMEHPKLRNWAMLKPMDKKKQLTLKEFSSLLAIGLTRGNRAPAIPIEHSAKLTTHGYVVGVAGGLRITTRGRVQIEAEISKPRTIGSVAAPICRAGPDASLERQSRPPPVHGTFGESAYAICDKPEPLRPRWIATAARPDLEAFVVIRHRPRNPVGKPTPRRRDI